MCWRRARYSYAYLLAGGVFAQVAGSGCARPAGELFPPLDPPRVWPPAPEKPRIRLVGALHGSDDLRAETTSREALAAALRGPRQPIRFITPHAVAVQDGRLLAVADTGLAGVHVLDLAGRTHTLVTGWGDERFSAPVGVCWVGQRLFVTDAGRHEVVELSPAGGFVRRFGADELTRPVGIAYAAPRDRLYIVDGGAHRLVIFDLSGRLEATLGGPGPGEGEFNYPTQIAAGPDGLAVADSANFRVQLLDFDGNSRSTIGKKGDAAGDFALPKGVAFDGDGHVYVVDAQFENVQIFDRQGRLLLAFGGEGAALGNFALPAGLAIDAHDRIWVADGANHRVQVFDYLKDAT